MAANDQAPANFSRLHGTILYEIVYKTIRIFLPDKTVNKLKIKSGNKILDQVGTFRRTPSPLKNVDIDVDDQSRLLNAAHMQAMLALVPILMR